MHTGGVLLRRAGLRGLSRWLDVGARANSSSSRSTTLSKHNVLMEGIPRKSDKAGGIVSCFFTWGGHKMLRMPACKGTKS